MKNKQWIALSLVTVTVLTTLTWDGTTASEKALLESQVQSAELKGQPLAQASQKVTWESVVQTLFNQRPPTTRRPGGGRGEVCAIAPAGWGDTTTLWNTRPLFVWAGNVRTIGVRPSGTKIMPPRKVASAEKHSMNRVAYTEKPLTPGNRYDWLFFFDQNSTSPMLQVSFQVMADQDRVAIAQALHSLEKRLKTQKTTNEEIALQRAHYFTQRGLQADALQEIYSVDRPSAELQEIRKAIAEKVCSDKTRQIKNYSTEPVAAVQIKITDAQRLYR